MKNITMVGILLWSLVSAQAWASIHEGKVVGVSDGDTLTVLISGRQIKVRLAEIDAPEKRQPFGERSKQSLSDLVYGKWVEVNQQDLDRYGRVVGRVYAESAGGEIVEGINLLAVDPDLDARLAKVSAKG